MCNLGYHLSRADLDIYLKPVIKSNRFRYYKILLEYSDNILSISHKLLEAINRMRTVFKLKREKAKVSKIYLGGDITEVENTNSI